KKPILGICLGMQLFAEESDEMGHHKGLGWIPGRVSLIDVREKNLSLPHVGWNNAHFDDKTGFSKRLEKDSHFYFDHSYHFQCDPKYVISSVEYGERLIAGVRKDHIIGFQFHP